MMLAYENRSDQFRVVHVSFSLYFSCSPESMFIYVLYNCMGNTHVASQSTSLYNIHMMVNPTKCIHRIHQTCQILPGFIQHPYLPGLVNLQKAIENGHRNSGFTH